MSSLLYPESLPGLTFDYKRRYEWNTGIQTAVSRQVSALAYQQYPVALFEYAYEFLRDTSTFPEIQTLVGLHNNMAGRFDTFLHLDPDFNSVTAQQFAVADGTAGPFQLTALYTPPSGAYAGVGAAEIVQNLNGTPVLKDNGSTISAANYTIGATGLVTFGATHFPVAGHLLTWTGGFYYRCRFDEDVIDWVKFMNGLWSSSKIAFTQDIL